MLGYDLHEDVAGIDGPNTSISNPSEIGRGLLEREIGAVIANMRILQGATHHWLSLILYGL